MLAVAGWLTARSARPYPPANSSRSRSATAIDRPGTWPRRIIVVMTSLTPSGAAPGFSELQLVRIRSIINNMMRSRTNSVKPLSAQEVRDEGVDPLFLVWLAARSTEDLLDRVLAPAGVKGDEFAMYSVLAASPGITPSELSRWMAAPPTSVSSYVKRLEARGHLTRRPHPRDRRSYRIHLTAAGKRTHLAAVTLFTPVRTHVIEALADQETPVRQALMQLRSIVDDLRTDLNNAGSPQA